MKYGIQIVNIDCVRDREVPEGVHGFLERTVWKLIKLPYPSFP